MRDSRERRDKMEKRDRDGRECGRETEGRGEIKWRK